jgi:MFS family permease
MSPSSLYIIGSALSAVGTSIVMAGINNPYAAMTGAAIASLGVGNFFTQMYNYLTAKYPKHNREISVILSVTMALASLTALPARYLVDWTGIQNVSIAYSLLCLVVSLVLTNNMMKDSTLYQFISQMLGNYKPLKPAAKTAPAKDTKIPGKMIEKEQRPIPPTDINNPLHN